MQIKDRVALVTGAASGIGEAVVRELARRGVRAVILVDRSDRVFALAPSGLTTPLETWLGMGYFGVQVFADFAGYSAIAIGLASLMGLRFPRNFLYPFLARGPTEFWSRWHVTLSTWLRDYLYVPLGGNRRGRARTYVNLMITMVLAGVWHGAAWTVIAWGGLHGLGMCVDRALRRRRPADWPVDAPRGVAGLGLRALQILAFQVFLHTGWTLFRAPDFATTAALLERLWVAPFREGLGLHRLGDLRFLVLVAPVVLMHAVRALNEWYGVRERSIQRVVAAALMLVALVLLRRDVAQDFFYFQF